MILVEIRPSGGTKTVVAVHPNVTVLRGLDDAARTAWVDDLAKALHGEEASLTVEVDVAGKRQVLTKALASQLGLDPTSEVTVLPADLPGARTATPPDAAASDDAGREVRTSKARAAELDKKLLQAQRAAKEAAAELGKAKAGVDDTAAAKVPGLEAILATARATAEDARRKLADAEMHVARLREAQSAERAEFRSAIEQLQQERAKLEAERTELVGRMIETGDPGDPKPVEEALSGLRRLQSVKPKPSSRANELAEEWTAACARLAALPQPPQPPEWLVAPAMEALQEAREAVAAADAGGGGLDVDPARIAALDRAHREVLEAEQRTMKKSSRSNRKKLESAHAAEQAALTALGVTSYGEYLQRVAPMITNGGGNREDRLASAKAALADAEAVWEELHGGQASPEWTEAKQHQAAIRQEAHELLGVEVGDAGLAAALRGHLETVVDTGWAEQALVTALHRAGTDLADDADLEAETERWLQEAPAKREARATLETQLSDIDARLSVVEEQLAERQANDFFGDDDPPPATEATGGPGSVDTLRARLEDAEATEREAESSLQRLRFEVSAAETKKTVVSALEQTAEARRTEVDALTAELAEAEAALAQAQATAADAATEAASNAPGPNSGALDLSGVVAMEAEAYLLARAAALRGATGGPLPMIVDGGVLAGLSERAGRRVYRLLGRLADSMQLVVLGDDEEIARWAEGLGDRAAVRTVAR